MGAGYHGGFGKTSGPGRSILSAESKFTALGKIKTLTKKIQSSYTKYVKDTTTSKYADYKITKTVEGIFIKAKNREMFQGLMRYIIKKCMKVVKQLRYIKILTIIKVI